MTIRLTIHYVIGNGLLIMDNHKNFILDFIYNVIASRFEISNYLYFTLLSLFHIRYISWVMLTGRLVLVIGQEKMDCIKSVFK